MRPRSAVGRDAQMDQQDSYDHTTQASRPACRVLANSPVCMHKLAISPETNSDFVSSVDFTNGNVYVAGGCVANQSITGNCPFITGELISLHFACICLELTVNFACPAQFLCTFTLQPKLSATILPQTRGLLCLICLLRDSATRKRSSMEK